MICMIEFAEFWSAGEPSDVQEHKGDIIDTGGNDIPLQFDESVLRNQIAGH